MSTFSLRATPRAPDLYRAVWRWHFYAGLLCLPFLILLSVTGGIYLFRYQLDPVIHRHLMQVEGRSEGMQAPQAWLDAAKASQPGTPFRVIPPPASDRSAEIGIKTPEGARTVVYVDPYTSTVLGSLSDKGTAMWFVRQLHSLAYAGTFARALIEIAGGWTILLVGTGIYLWWPRSASTGGVVSVRGRPQQRVFWRDLHAVTGLFVGSILLFLAVTGMPWSVFWGSYANQWANGSNFGYPAGVRVGLPMSDEHLGHMTPTNWTLQQARVPESPMPPMTSSIGLDGAVAAFNKLGLDPGYAIALPGGPRGVYSGSVYPNDLAKQRVVHLDQYTGRPLLDMSYADYGPLGRALEWGINVHMGQQWGWLNQVVLLAACFATVLLSVSAGVMWWKRRPSGTFGVPPMPDNPRALRGLLIIVAIGGVLFPLVGASFVLLLAVDLLVVRRLQARVA